MANSILEAKEISLNRLNKKILNPVSFEVSRRITSIVGNKNSGKKELLLILSKYLLPSTGKVIYNYRLNVGLSEVEEAKPFIESFSVYENVDFFFRAAGKKLTKRQIRDFLERFELSVYIDTLIEDLDEFHTALLSASIAFINDPRLILLSDPTKDLAEEKIEKFWKIIIKNIQDKYLLFTTNEKSEAEKYSQEVILL